MFSTPQSENGFNPLWQNGPSPGSFYNFPGNSVKTVAKNEDFGKQRSA